jgi:hypothetical protein
MAVTFGPNQYAGMAQGTVGLAQFFAGLGQQSKARKELQRRQQEIEALPIPDVEKMRISEDLLAEYAQYAPEALGPSQYEQITDDPRLIADQRASLDALSARAAGSFTPEYLKELAMNEMRAQQQSQAARGAEDARARRQGTFGSGISQANKAIADQSATNAAYIGGLGTVADQDAQRMAASQALGSLAGNIRGQNFDIASQKASAADAISRFNKRYSQ